MVDHPELLELDASDRALVAQHPPATGSRASFLATELLPRGCYMEVGDATAMKPCTV